MIIDKANAFYLRPVAGDSAQTASNVLDFGTAEAAAKGNLAGWLNVVTTASGGSVKLQDSADNSTFVDLAGTTVTVSAAGTYCVAMPAHKRYVKAVLTTLTPSNTDVYIGARADVE